MSVPEPAVQRPLVTSPLGRRPRFPSAPSHAGTRSLHLARSLWVELRPRQWVKNVMVLAPLVFSQNLFELRPLGRALAACALFCIISSSVYILNDLKDAPRDRLHPEKRHRPIAAGALGVGPASVAMLVLLLAGLLGALALSRDLAWVLVAYWSINLLYSFWLKNQVILDVFSIAGGFVLRVLGGGLAIEVPSSDWLLVCTTLVALLLGFAKRRHELALLGEHAAAHRRVLGDYSPRVLDLILGIVTTATVMSYALYTVSDETVRKFQTRALLFTFPFVLYGLLRYLYLVYERDQGGDPSYTLLTDVPTLANLCLWALVVGFILYR